MAASNFADRTFLAGDNLDVLGAPNSETVDLIYLDPPYNSDPNYETPVASRAAGAAFKDAFTLSCLDDARTGLIVAEYPALACALLERQGTGHW